MNSTYFFILAFLIVVLDSTVSAGVFSGNEIDRATSGSYRVLASNNSRKLLSLEPTEESPTPIVNNEIHVPQLSIESKVPNLQLFHLVPQQDLAGINEDSFFYDESQRKRRVLLDYMDRKLVEHKYDQFSESNPFLLPAHESHEVVSKISLDFEREYKVGFRYSLSGNYLQLNLDNPYKFNAGVRWEMDPSQFGPNEVLETVVMANYQLTSRASLGYLQRVNGHDYTMSASHLLVTNLTAQLTYSSYNTPTDIRPADVTEKIYIFGLSWTL